MPSIWNVVGITTVPDWVREVISPGTARLDCTRKMPVYAREGVHHLSLVDPIARTLEVYRLENGRWAVAGTYGGDESLRTEPVEAIALDMSRWWMPA
ncbi:MAG TPA: Uma2 family endonuclease [Candidatus Binatia bacterium]|nr:Uma2 family endonuclease [Candidatus Binatia bacterium]